MDASSLEAIGTTPDRRTRVPLLDLFRANARIALHSFGGAAPWAFRVFVEERKWLSREEFTEAWALFQLVPGPNVVNLSIWLGDRHRGLRGALVSFVALLGIPTVIAIAIDTIVVHWMHMPVVTHALAGVASGAAGLVIAMGVRMGGAVARRPATTAIALAAFVALVVLHVPLLGIVAVLAPVGIANARRSP